MPARLEIESYSSYLIYLNLFLSIYFLKYQTNLMAYKDSANTANKYFLLLGDRILDCVELNPDGVCEADDVQLFINRSSIFLSDVGLKAHKWVIGQLHHYNNEYTKGRMSEHELVEAYGYLNLEGYLRHVAYETYKEVRGKWETRVVEYDLKGDVASVNYCLRRLELMAIARSQGTTLKQIFKSNGWEGYLDREYQPIEYQFVDPDLLDKFGREAWEYTPDPYATHKGSL